MIYYFAYGSNMDLRIVKKRGVVYKKRFKGLIKGYTIKFNTNLFCDWKSGIGYANIIPSENSIVEGIVYETDSSSIIKLDHYEIFPLHYDKKIFRIETEKGEIKCIVYVAQSETINENLKPEKEYLKHLLAGKKFLSKRYYNFIKNTNIVN